MARYEVGTYYACDGLSFDKDDAATKAVGRESDNSGWGLGERDLSWICESKSEAKKIEQALEKIGMLAFVTRF